MIFSSDSNVFLQAYGNCIHYKKCNWYSSSRTKGCKFCWLRQVKRSKNHIQNGHSHERGEHFHCQNFLGGWRWCLHPKGILFRLSRRRFSKDTTKLQMHSMPIRNLNQGVTANNCTSLLRKALSHTTSWLDPTGICSLSLLTCSMCFTWSDLHSFVEISNTSYNTKLISQTFNIRYQTTLLFYQLLQMLSPATFFLWILKQMFTS